MEMLSARLASDRAGSVIHAVGPLNAPAVFIHPCQPLSPSSEVMMKCWRNLLIVAGLIAYPIFAQAQQSAPLSQKPKSAGEIAKASRMLAEKNESCRRQAREEKLTGLKRYRFIRACRKK